MARNDGIDRTCARNVKVKDCNISNTQAHNEREKESYRNPDIVAERSQYNVHFKTPDSGYEEMFERMKAEGAISTRGLKADAIKFNELVFDVNSAYFYNHGGYEFAKQFYSEAYKAAVKIIGGEQYILSAVMHADEKNRAMSDALGEDVFHYHLHVVFVPVVEKQILWSKRCKDPALRGTVKETIVQVSDSKKWMSAPALNDQGEPILQSNGKPVLRKSYSVLQDDFYNAMRAAGYTDLERGERGSTEEHLTVTQFKVLKEQDRLSALDAKIESKQAQLNDLKQKTKLKATEATTLDAIDRMGKRTLLGKVEFTQQEAVTLKDYAKKGVVAKGQIGTLQQKLASANQDAQVWHKRYTALETETKDFLAALKRAPDRVKRFIESVLRTEIRPEQQEKQQKTANRKHTISR